MTITLCINLIKFITKSVIMHGPVIISSSILISKSTNKYSWTAINRISLIIQNKIQIWNQIYLRSNIIRINQILTRHNIKNKTLLYNYRINHKKINRIMHSRFYYLRIYLAILILKILKLIMIIKMRSIIKYRMINL